MSVYASMRDLIPVPIVKMNDWNSRKGKIKKIFYAHQKFSERSNCPSVYFPTLYPVKIIKVYKSISIILTREQWFFQNFKGEVSFILKCVFTIKMLLKRLSVHISCLKNSFSTKCKLELCWKYVIIIPDWYRWRNTLISWKV